MGKKYKNYKNHIPDTNKGRTPIMTKLINAHFKGEEAELSKEEQVIIQRWKRVESLSRQHRPCISPAKIAQSLMTDFGVSEATAYRDITDAQKLFGNVNKVNKEFKRAIYIEWLEQAASLAEIRGDIKSMVMALDKAAQIMGMHKENEETNSEVSRTFNLNLFVGKGDSVERTTIDLDNLESIPATDIKEIVKLVDKPRISVDAMNLLLDKHHGEPES